MEITELDKILKHALRIDPKRNYWLFRTQGGHYYEHFKQDGFIAIGYDYITLDDIIGSQTNETSPLELLINKIRIQQPDEKRPKYGASQLMRFTYEIKEGDIVLIPSVSSQSITIGEVLQTEVKIEEEIKYPSGNFSEHEICTYQKRKPVKWLKEVRRDDLEPILYKLLFSHHIITEATSYANYIDNMLNDFYIKGNEANLILNVQTEEDIKARDLFNMGYALLNVVDEFCKENNLAIDTSDVEVKLTLQSPGRIQLSTKKKGVAVIIGILVIGAFGGGFKIKSGSFELDLSTVGLIQKVIDYQNNQQNRDIKKQVLDNNIKKLQIQKPEDLIKVLEMRVQDSNDKPSKSVND
ncbi:hypothetical protein [Tellurirhabdus bombi]|uniref:hypothetical protein n=1 Tax=Tellurirhabdus bombi TaxID=2907205 RepID=UPI001F1C1B3A|nr:hypothetical protein [Tellurirhabdus bombi]